MVTQLKRPVSSLVRHPYYAPNSFTLDNMRLLIDSILEYQRKSISMDQRLPNMDEYTLIFSFLTLHKVCTKARTVGRAFGSISKVEGCDSIRVN